MVRVSVKKFLYLHILLLTQTRPSLVEHVGLEKLTLLLVALPLVLQNLVADAGRINFSLAPITVQQVKPLALHLILNYNSSHYYPLDACFY